MNGSSSFFNIKKRNFGAEKKFKAKNDKNSPMRFKTRDSEGDFPWGDVNQTENYNGAHNVLESPCQIQKKIRTLLDNETESAQTSSINAQSQSINTNSVNGSNCIHANNGLTVDEKIIDHFKKKESTPIPMPAGYYGND